MDKQQEIIRQKMEAAKIENRRNKIKMFLPKIMQKLNITVQKLIQSEMHNIFKIILGFLLIITMQPIELLMKTFQPFKYPKKNGHTGSYS